MAVTFNTLRKDATIFEELKKNPAWWQRFKSDDSFFIEIRKDNQVNVYFEGGSVARIHYCSKHKKLQVFTHHKYLGIEEEKPMYVECSDYINEEIDKIIPRIKEKYSQKKAVNGSISKEDWSEKFIQSGLIKTSEDIHLDSEFAYKDDVSDNRIDLVKVVGGDIVFVELKRLDDGRMLKSSEDAPEIVTQMMNYESFIGKYSEEILDYYQRLYDIKADLGLPIPMTRPERVRMKPELLIFNRWIKLHVKRDIHEKRMRQILEREGVAYSIISEI